MDLTGLLRTRLSEHAMHTRGVAVALDPSARVSRDAVSLADLRAVFPGF